MPKRLIKKYMPTREKIRSLKSLHFLGEILHEPNLWHINRHSVSRAFFIGIFWCLIPIPFQMPIAAFFAIWFNGNLPLAVALVWVSNPLTMTPMLYLNYRVGAWVLGQSGEGFYFEMSWEWVRESLVHFGIPIYLGAFICGIVFACCGYLVIQFLWRRKIRHDWRVRRAQRALRIQQH